MEPVSDIEDAKITCQRLAAFMELSGSGANSTQNSTSNSPNPASPNHATAPSSPATSAVNVNSDDASVFIHWGFNSSSPLLILDLRSFLVYNQSHIKASINVCIPKTLAKRQGFTVKNIESGICKKSDKDLFKSRKGATVILYDQCGYEKDPNSLLEKCYEALVREGLCYQVYWLEGGFTKMQHDYSENIRCSRTPCGLLKSGQRPNLTLGKSTNLSSSSSSSNSISSSCSFFGLNAAPFTAPANLTNLEDPIIEITDYLYLSGSHIAEDRDCLRKYQIAYIINTAVELQNSFDDCDEFVYKRLDLTDHPSQHMCVVNVFENAFKFIEEARKNGKKTLVHCRGGRSRSATIVIAYLMRTYNWSLQQAYDHVQSKNPKISPNLGFMGQLISFENLLRKARVYEQREYGDDLRTHLNASQSLEGLNSLGSVSLDVHS